MLVETCWYENPSSAMSLGSSSIWTSSSSSPKMSTADTPLIAVNFSSSLSETLFRCFAFFPPEMKTCMIGKSEKEISFTVGPGSCWALSGNLPLTLLMIDSISLFAFSISVSSVNWNCMSAAPFTAWPT